MSSALYIELTTGPLASSIAPLIATRSPENDAAIAALLNTKNIAVQGDVSADLFMAWLASGPITIVQSTAANTSDPLQASAIILQMAISSAQPLKFTTPDDTALISAWVAAGKITSAQEAALLALGQYNISRAQQLGITVMPYDVSATLNNGGN